MQPRPRRCRDRVGSIVTGTIRCVAVNRAGVLTQGAGEDPPRGTSSLPSRRELCRTHTGRAPHLESLAPIPLAIRPPIARSRFRATRDSCGRQVAGDRRPKRCWCHPLGGRSRHAAIVRVNWTGARLVLVLPHEASDDEIEPPGNHLEPPLAVAGFLAEEDTGGTGRSREQRTQNARVNTSLVRAGRALTHAVVGPISVGSSAPLATGGNTPSTTPSWPVTSSRASRILGHQRMRPLVTGRSGVTRNDGACPAVRDRQADSANNRMETRSDLPGPLLENPWTVRPAPGDRPKGLEAAAWRPPPQYNVWGSIRHRLVS